MGFSLLEDRTCRRQNGLAPPCPSTTPGFTKALSSHRNFKSHGGRKSAPPGVQKLPLGTIFRHKGEIQSSQAKNVNSTFLNRLSPAPLLSHSPEKRRHIRTPTIWSVLLWNPPFTALTKIHMFSGRFRSAADLDFLPSKVLFTLNSFHLQFER